MPRDGPKVLSTSLQRREFLRRLLVLQEGKCWWCARKIGMNSKGLRNPTIEHLVPRGAKGGKGIRNLVASCKGCNNERGDSLSWVVHPTVAKTKRNSLIDGNHRDLMIALGYWRDDFNPKAQPNDHLLAHDPPLHRHQADLRDRGEV